MDRTAFEYIFIHANSLAEISLLRCAEKIEAELANAPDPLADLSIAEREALVEAQMRKMQEDWEAGIKSPLDEFYEELAARPVEPLPPEFEEAPAPRGGDGATEATGGPFDLSVYLDKAYGAGAQIAGRIDRAMRAIDMAALEASLAALPAGLPPLSAPMDAAGFEQWLALNDEMNEALDDVITSIRFIDFEP